MGSSIRINGEFAEVIKRERCSSSVVYLPVMKREGSLK